MEKEMRILTGMSGAMPIASGSEVTINTKLNVVSLIAGENGATITTIRLQEIGSDREFEYADVDESFTWDGAVLGAFDILQIPDSYRLKSIELSSGNLKGIFLSKIAFKEVV
jgi:hypothetical protein